MKEFAKHFYTSRTWKNARNAYVKSVRGLCEMCMLDNKYTPGAIVHHVIPVTPDNINDAKITLDHDNLLLLCRECHANVHHKDIGRPKSSHKYDPERCKELIKNRRYMIDADGKIIDKTPQ